MHMINKYDLSRRLLLHIINEDSYLHRTQRPWRNRIRKHFLKMYIFFVLRAGPSGRLKLLPARSYLPPNSCKPTWTGKKPYFWGPVKPPPTWRDSLAQRPFPPQPSIGRDSTHLIIVSAITSQSYNCSGTSLMRSGRARKKRSIVSR